MVEHAGANGNCPDYGSTLDPCPPGCASGTCVYAAPEGQRVSDAPRISDHAYDCGPSEETGGPCIATVNASGGAYEGTENCGAPRDRHERTEYDRNPGDMHEPPEHSSSRLYFGDPDGYSD